MKKLIAVFLIFSVLFSLCCCGQPQQEEPLKENFTKYAGVVYASNSPSQTLDIYLPNEGNGPYPVIFAIHGGGFSFGSADMCKEMIAFTEYGYAVVGVNYRLSGEAIFPSAVSDCKAAVRFIRAEGEKYNLDVENMAVWGASAGANLAVMVGVLGNTDILNGDVNENLQFSSKVNAVIDWFGPLDFFNMDSDFATLGITEADRSGPLGGLTSREDSPESKYLGQNVGLDEEFTQRSNPISYLPQVKAEELPSFFIQHGNADTNVPYLQSQRLYDELLKLIEGNKVTFEILDGAKHEDAMFKAKDNIGKVRAFLDGILK